MNPTEDIHIRTYLWIGYLLLLLCYYCYTCTIHRIKPSVNSWNLKTILRNATSNLFSNIYPTDIDDITTTTTATTAINMKSDDLPISKWNICKLARIAIEYVNYICSPLYGQKDHTRTHTHTKILVTNLTSPENEDIKFLNRIYRPLRWKPCLVVSVSFLLYTGRLVVWLFFILSVVQCKVFIRFICT